MGSHLVDRLLREGHRVVGLDKNPTSPDVDAGCGEPITARAGDFSFRQCDLAVSDLAPLLQGTSRVFHLAGVSGVRESWGDRYADYVYANVLGTQRLLEACSEVGVGRVVIASSSSVYGSAERPSRVDDLPRPLSPYGVSKLAAEQLALAYAQNRPFEVCVLRYFTVYGPRQRLTMLMSRVLHAAHTGSPMTVYGDGSQRRHFTYVDDAVEATVLAGSRALSGTHVINVAGSRSISVSEVLATAEAVIGTPITVRHQANWAGDVVASQADLSEASVLLGYRPRVDLAEGLAHHRDWYRASITQNSGPRASLTAAGGTQ